MKLKLWHLILQKIVKVSLGQKNQTFCQIYMKKSFLSLPITFSVLVNVIPYQIFIQNTQITVFKKISTKFGALPLLQECPKSLCSHQGGHFPNLAIMCVDLDIINPYKTAGCLLFADKEGCPSTMTRTSTTLDKYFCPLHDSL